jgi:hypothetical protein
MNEHSRLGGRVNRRFTPRALEPERRDFFGSCSQGGGVECCAFQAATLGYGMKPRWGKETRRPGCVLVERNERFRIGF